MKYRRLGRTDIEVSLIGLGTMTWGRQNTEAEGHAQMDYALDQGVNFWDTAEMYAIPPIAASYGTTETIIGTWFASRGRRDQVILASKAIGRAPQMTWIREGKARLDRANLTRAVEDSLRRLRTDYIDLYQLHWPDRKVNNFGVRYFPAGQDDADATPIAETVLALGELIAAGKIRHYGLSNETPWGTMTFLRLADELGVARPVSIQNPYSLLNRSFEIGLSEIALRESCGLLAYSPLAAGTLTGKYLDGRIPPGTRRAIDHRRSRYAGELIDRATRAYVDLARAHGLAPNQMALAFVNAQPFVTSNLIGATSMEHLTSNIASIDLELPPEVLEGIAAIQARFPDPAA